MSVKVFFTFSAGLSRPLHCPTGTLASILKHVAEIERRLGIEPGKDGWHWSPRDKALAAVEDDKYFCETVEQHNAWVRRLYEQFGEWGRKPVKGGDRITPKEAQTFWHALTELYVDPHRWTGDYYRARMESLYEVMRGRPSEGISFDATALTPEQASNVIRLFERYLDTEDLRLECPVGHDYLASSSDGGYSWCSKHGAIAEDDLGEHSRKRCDLGRELRAEARA